VFRGVGWVKGNPTKMEIKFWDGKSI